jgi:hypothetical protein
MQMQALRQRNPSPVQGSHSADPVLHRYIPVHLQYIMTELLKNAFRATGMISVVDHAY